MDEKRRIRGVVRYCMKKINKDKLKSVGLVTHDLAIRILNNRNTPTTTNVAIASNYPWVYSPKTKRESDVEQEKVLIIPFTKLLTQSSHNEFYKIIMMDKRAEYNEIQCLLNRQKADVIKRGKQLDYTLITSQLKVSIDQLMERNEIINERDETIAVTSDRIKCIPNPFFFKNVQDFLQKKIDSNVQYISAVLKRVKMYGNVSLIDKMQGRHSIIRNSMVKKVDGLRGQILLQSRLLPNQVILPLVWQSIIGVFAKKCVDIQSAGPIDPECWIKLLDLRICMKRDPVINLNSNSFYDEIAFADSSCIYIGQGELENKHADFDGDVQAVFLIRDPDAIREIDAKMLPQSSSRSLFQMRYTFQENFVLMMHQRRLPDSFKYKHVYETIREFEIKKWKLNETNIKMMESLNSLEPNIDFDRFIEPTNVILNKFLHVISNLYGPEGCFEGYSIILNEMIKLANHEPSEFYDENLQNVFFMEKDILCEGIIRSCFSGAKGTLVDLFAMASRLKELDGTTKITDKKCGIKHAEFFRDVEKSITKVVDASRAVTKTGHEFFLSNIGFESISFNKNQIYINEVSTGCSLEIFNPLLLIDNHTSKILYNSIMK